MSSHVQPVQLATNSQVGGYLEGHGSTVDEDRKVSLGMLFYILNDVILAIFFIGTYIFLRGYDTNVRWFPAGTSAPQDSVLIIAMVGAVAGAVSYQIGYRALRAGSQSAFRLFTVLALLLFLADAVYAIYTMGHLPFTVADGSFAVSYLLLSGYHIYHMLLAVFVTFAIANRGLKGMYTQEFESHARAPHGTAPLQRFTGPKSVGYYNTWAAIFAVLFWLLLIVQPPQL